MRITGGGLKGYLTECPKGIIRPAMDRMRESVFFILGDLANKSFLDLFSGSATIALEAASRGSRDVSLCEKDKGKVKVILKNIKSAEERLGIKINCHFMPSEYFVTRCKRSFDIIFMDPPFIYSHALSLIQSIIDNKVLTPNGLLLYHHPAEVKVPPYCSTLTVIKTKTYGRSVVEFLQRKEGSFASDKD